MFKPTLLASALALLLAVPAYAQNYDNNQFNLTSYQSEEIRQIRSQNQGLLRQVVQLGKELQQACESGDTYRQDQVQRELSALKPQVKSMHRSINQVLTPQQRREAKQVTNKLEDRMSNRNRCTTSYGSESSYRSGYSPSYDSGRTYNGTYNQDNGNYNAYAYQSQVPYTSYDSRYGTTPYYPSTNYAPNYGGYAAPVPYGSPYGSPYGNQQQDVGSALLNQVLFSVLNQVLLKP